MMAENTSAANDLPAVAFTLEPREVTTSGGEVFEIWVPSFEANTVDVDVNEVVNSDVKAAAKSGSNSRGPRPNQESVELRGGLSTSCGTKRLRSQRESCSTKPVLWTRSETMAQTIGGNCPGRKATNCRERLTR